MFIKQWCSVILVGLSLVIGFAQTLNYAALAAAGSTATQTGQTSTQTPKMRLNALSTNTTSGLTPAAEEAASLLGILPKVERLMQLSKNRTDLQSMSDEELSLRVDVLDKIMGGSLEVRMVAGRIDREIAWAFSGQGMLQAKRQKILNFLFAATFMQGGTLGTLSGPCFLHGNPRAGSELLLLASSIGLGLSTISFIEARSGSKKMDMDPTVLTYIFGLDAPEPLHKPVIVTKYLAAVPPHTNGTKTRIEILKEGWEKGHYLKSTQERDLERLAGLEPDNVKFSEDLALYAARIRMLFDTQWTIEQLDGGLLDLMRAVDVS